MTEVKNSEQKPAISVGSFVLRNSQVLQVDNSVETDALNRSITRKRLQKLGMAMAGFPGYLQPGRVYVFGNTEARFLQKSPPGQKTEIFERLIPESLTCILVTQKREAPVELRDFCSRHGIPLLLSQLDSSAAMHLFTEFLELELSPVATIHGVLMEVFGAGVLITGESSIGKSECALDLILRGHRLVADDLVELKNVGNKVLLGSAPQQIRDLLELRGIGIVNIRHLFGVSAIRKSKEVDFIVQLERWNPSRDYERLGFTMKRRELAGVALPYMTIPVAMGRNLAALLEIACRVFLMRVHNIHPLGENLKLLAMNDPSFKAEET